MAPLRQRRSRRSPERSPRAAGRPRRAAVVAPTKSATNPFGLGTTSSVEAVIFNGGYGYDYVKFAADQVKKQKGFSGVTLKVSPSTQIAQQLQPRFVGGNPPDLIDNSGANAIGFSTIQQQLETLDDVFEANNYEGTKILGTLYPNVKNPGHLRRQVHRAELRDDGLRHLVLRRAVPAERLDGAADLGRDDSPRRQGQGQGQVPLGVGQGGGDVLPDDGRQLRHQGGRRRGPPGAGEPQAEMLVAPADPERLPGSWRDSEEGLHGPRRRRHPVHRRPGEVEQRRAGDPLSVRRLDRERDEGARRSPASR